MKITLDLVSQELQKQGYNQVKVHKFLCWYKQYPEVWRNFERITLNLIASGKKAGSIDILARIRWECEIEGGNDYKCDNNYAPFLARIFVMKHPADFFDFREVGYERQAA